MYISRGNIKVKCNIWSLPSGITCKRGLSCSKYCYAKKAERQYKQVLPCRNNNLKASKSKNFVNNTVDILSKRKNKYVRIHESGDFYSTGYIISWYLIAEKLPEYTFYAYTKRSDLFTKSILKNKPKNLILIFSIDGIQKYNEAEFTRLKNKYCKLGFDSIALATENNTTCPAQIKKEVMCIKDCKKCLLTDHVAIFKKH